MRIVPPTTSPTRSAICHCVQPTDTFSSDFKQSKRANCTLPWISSFSSINTQTPTPPLPLSWFLSCTSSSYFPAVIPSSPCLVTLSILAPRSRPCSSPIHPRARGILIPSFLPVDPSPLPHKPATFQTLLSLSSFPSLRAYGYFHFPFESTWSLRKSIQSDPL